MGRRYYNNKPELVPGDVIELNHALHFEILGDIDKVVVKSVGKLLRFYPYDSTTGKADTSSNLRICRGSWRYMETKLIGFIPGADGLSRDALIKRQKEEKNSDAACLKMILNNLPFAPEGTVTYHRRGQHYEFYIVQTNGCRLNGYSIENTRDRILRTGKAFEDDSLLWLRGVRWDQQKRSATNP